MNPSHAVVAEGLAWMVGTGGDEGGGFEIIGFDLTTGAKRRRVSSAAGRNGWCTGAVAVAEGVVFFIDFDGDAAPPLLSDQDSGRIAGTFTLHAIDIESNTTLWTKALPGDRASSPSIAGGVVYATTREGMVLALDATSGGARWTLEAGDKILDANELPGEFYGYDESAVAVLPANGALYVRAARGIVALR